MLIKKEGTINKIIYNNTTYYNGECRIYPPIIELKGLVDKIIESKSTTKYIRFTPFYLNAKLHQQIEFDDYMFYMECREHFDESTLKNHIELCMGKEFAQMSSEEIKFGSILYPLCEYHDLMTYKKSLKVYVKFLDKLIPKMMIIAKSKMDLKDEELGFGYFCFEVHSE